MDGHIREHDARLESAQRALEAEIAARHEVAEALRQSEERFEAFAESLPVLIWTCGPDGRCDYVSRQLLEYAGCAAVRLLGGPWTQYVHPDDRDSVESAWASAMAGGDTFDAELRLRRADGAYRWFRTHAAALRDSSGCIVKWFGSHTDIEESRQAHLGAAAQLERLRLLDRITRAIGERQDLHSIFRVVLRQLEDHLPIDFGCVCMFDVQQQLMTIACIGAGTYPVFADLGMPEGSAIGIDEARLSLLEQGQLVYEPELARAESEFAQRLAQGSLRSVVMAPLAAESKVFGVLVTARRKPRGFSGEECEFVRQLSGNVALAAGQAQMYTALQQAYEELRQTTRTVLQQERLRALGQMASGIAHDINNTISPIAIYTQSLLDHEPGLSERARKYLETIERAVEAVEQTVARLREFYRPREAQLPLPQVDLNELARQVIDLTRARWSDLPQQRGVAIDVRTELSPGVPVIRGADGEIRDALTNLVFNAVDAMPEGGALTLKTSISDSHPGQDAQTCRYVCIEVRDTGVGMDDETRRRCVEPFFTTKGEHGTGLGLAGVYGMARRHEAILQIDSRPGGGTTVRLMFPESASESISSDKPSPPRKPHSLRILLVDDDPAILESLRNTLRSDGHFVTAVEGGQAGIDTFNAAVTRAEPFAIVITDLGMPYVDGRKVAMAIRRTSPGTPVIMLTGWGRRLTAESEVPVGVDRILPKPPRLQELRVALAELTERTATVLQTSDARDREHADG